MTNEEYMKMLYTFNYAYDNDKKLIIEWANGLKVLCASETGVYETDTEPGDEDYIGEYATFVEDVEVLLPGRDDSVPYYPELGTAEITIHAIPERIELEDGTVLWERGEE